MVIVCVLLLARMLLRPRRRARVDASLRKGGEPLGAAHAPLRRLARGRAARAARDQGGDPARPPLGERARRQRRQPEGLQGQPPRPALSVLGVAQPRRLAAPALAAQVRLKNAIVRCQAWAAPASRRGVVSLLKPCCVPGCLRAS